MCVQSHARQNVFSQMVPKSRGEQSQMFSICESRRKSPSSNGGVTSIAESPCAKIWGWGDPVLKVVSMGLSYSRE